MCSLRCVESPPPPGRPGSIAPSCCHPRRSEHRGVPAASSGVPNRKTAHGSLACSKLASFLQPVKRLSPGAGLRALLRRSVACNVPSKGATVLADDGRKFWRGSGWSLRKERTVFIQAPAWFMNQCQLFVTIRGCDHLKCGGERHEVRCRGTRAQGSSYQGCWFCASTLCPSLPVLRARSSGLRAQSSENALCNAARLVLPS